MAHADEVAYFGDYYINRYYKRGEEKVTYKSFLFTDRSIYRPGQTVYFKAIAIKNNPNVINNKSEVLESTSVYAELFNTNGESVKKLHLKTNDYGSVSGEFILPNNGLNGQYRIEFNYDSSSGSDLIYFNSNTYFSVEEYKRPKFETTIICYNLRKAWENVSLMNYQQLAPHELPKSSKILLGHCTPLTPKNMIT